MIPKSKTGKLIWITGLACGLIGVAAVATPYISNERQKLQQRFAETHAFLENDESYNPFEATPLTQEQVNQRDAMQEIQDTDEPDTIKWSVLVKAKTEFTGEGANAKPHPVFTDDLSELDDRTLTARGYIYPLDQSAKQSHFLLTPFPPTCPYCLPAGPSQLIEVKMKRPIDFTYDAVSVKGEFKLLKNAETADGMFFKIDDGVLTK